MNHALNYPLKLPAHAYFVLMCLLPPTCFVGLQWLAASLPLPAAWSLLAPWFGAALTLAGLWLYVRYDLNQKLCQPLQEQCRRVDELTNDLVMAQTRRAAAHHYVDRLNVHLELARSNCTALSQSLEERLQQQHVIQQTHHRLALLGLRNQQSVSGYILKLGSQTDHHWQTNINAAEIQHLQTAHDAVDFYLVELGTPAYSTNLPLQPESPMPSAAADSTYNLRACVHDAITLLQPYLATGKNSTEHEIWPVYEPSCPVEFYGNRAFVRRAVFHYLLGMLDDFANPAQACWILRINLTGATNASSEIAFRLEVDAIMDQPDRPKKKHHDQQRQLSQLLSNSGGRLSDNGIYLPAQPTDSMAMRGHGLTVQIYPRDEKQRIGLLSCLRGLDIKITQHDSADLCIIGLTSDSAVKDITDGLDTTTTIILLNNPRVYQKAGWHVLPAPLHHQALINCIHRRSVRQLNARILVVDDDKNARLFLCTLLAEYGATVFEAADGVAALATAANETLDLIFMDIHMPRMNGLEATRQLRASIDRPLPIIALTAHVIDSEHTAMIEAGISATLIKPVDLSTLRQTLHEWLQAGGANQNSIHYRPMSVAPVFDTQLALKIANQRPQLAIEMLALFMQSLDTDQKSLRQAHSDNDLKRFSQQIHRLNGAARFCGIPRIQVLLHDMETLLKTHPELKNELTHELTKTMQQLHIELNSLRDWYQITANPLATNAKASNQLSNNT